MTEEFSKTPVRGPHVRKTERSKEELEFQLSLLQKRMNSPKVDLLEGTSAFTVRMELPGLTSDTIKVDLKDSHILLVSGFKREVSYEGKFKYKECKYGNFMRRVKLPGQVELNTAFTYENGVFTLHLTKKTTEVQEAAHATQIDKVSTSSNLNEVKSWADEE